MRTKQGLYVHYVRAHCKEVPEYEAGVGCTSCQKVHNSAGAYLYHVPKCFGLVIESAAETVAAKVETLSLQKETTNRIEGVIPRGCKT
jgi:hypothetical protein